MIDGKIYYREQKLPVSERRTAVQLLVIALLFLLFLGYFVLYGRIEAGIFCRR